MSGGCVESVAWEITCDGGGRTRSGIEDEGHARELLSQFDRFDSCGPHHLFRVTTHTITTREEVPTPTEEAR